MSQSPIRDQDGLVRLLVESIYLDLREAVSSESSEKWLDKRVFDVDGMIADVEADDSPDLAREETWCRFLEEVCERMGVSLDCLDDILTLHEFDSLVVDALRGLRG
jgi:hypothetical protein